MKKTVSNLFIKPLPSLSIRDFLIAELVEYTKTGKGIFNTLSINNKNFVAYYKKYISALLNVSPEAIEKLKSRKIPYYLKGSRLSGFVVYFKRAKEGAFKA